MTQGSSTHLIWSDEKRVQLDYTMLFSKSYDFEGFNYKAQGTDTPIGRFMIWPDHLSGNTDWNLYGGDDGLFQTGLKSENEAKDRVLQIVRSELLHEPMQKADHDATEDAFHARLP